MRISLLIKTNHPDQSSPKHYAQRRWFFSKTSWKKAYFTTQMSWSGRPVLALESAPSLLVNVRLRQMQLYLLPFLINVNFVEKKNYLHKSNMIYIVKREGLYQNKGNSSLNCNCKIGYYCFPFNFRCRCNVCLYYGLLLHVFNNQQKSD